MLFLRPKTKSWFSKPTRRRTAHLPAQRAISGPACSILLIGIPRRESRDIFFSKIGYFQQNMSIYGHRTVFYSTDDIGGRIHKNCTTVHFLSTWVVHLTPNFHFPFPSLPPLFGFYFLLSKCLVRLVLAVFLFLFYFLLYCICL